jgi:hypothetical protein
LFVYLKKVTKTGKQNLATPGVPMRESKFHSLVEEAERENFKSVLNLKKEVLSLWRKEHSK